MIISIFKDLNHVVWSDCSEHPDCVQVDNIEYNPYTQNIDISKDWEKYKIDISDKPNIETHDEKKSRITLALITSEDPTKVDTEWVTWFDIDFCISQRFFGWDRGKEIWFTQRFAYLLALTDLTEDQQAEKTLIIEWYEAKEKYKEFIKSLNK